MSSQNYESSRRHSTAIQDILKNGPRKTISSGGRFALETSKRIYDRGPRDLKAQIAESDNTADFRFPALQAFLTGLATSWFRLAAISIEAARDVSLPSVLSSEQNLVVPKKRKTKT